MAKVILFSNTFSFFLSVKLTALATAAFSSGVLAFIKAKFSAIISMQLLMY